MNRYRQTFFLIFLFFTLAVAPSIFSRGRGVIVPDGRIKLSRTTSDTLPRTDSLSALSDSLGLADSLQTTVPINPYAHIDSLTLAIPHEAEQNVHALAAYFKQTFTLQEELVRAIYVWTTHRISYNMYSTFTSRNDVFNPEEQLAELLQTRKGVCTHYVLLFYTLCKDCGVRCHTVHGYNKQGKQLMTNTHEWCVVLLDDQWFAVDPTMGAGYIENMQYYHQPNNDYYLLEPSRILLTHMPFDPLWQLSEKLISYREFDTGEMDTLSTKPYFAWRDTLDSYVRQDTLQRLERMYDRMRLLEGGNPLVNYALELAHSNIFTIKLQRIISSFNYANTHFDRGILSINSFIRYRNARFLPEKTDEEIWQMITDAETEIQLADSAINTIRETPEKYRNDIQYQKQLIVEASTRIYKERLFLQHYFETPVKKRKMLFLAGYSD